MLTKKKERPKHKLNCREHCRPGPVTQPLTQTGLYATPMMGAQTNMESPQWGNKSCQKGDFI